MINNKNLVTQRNTTFSIIVGIVCFLTNLSQLPVFVDAGLSSLVSMSIWIVFAGYLIFTCKLVFQPNLKYVIFFLFYFLMFIFSMQLFSDGNYFRSSIFTPVLLATFILFIGILAGDIIDKSTLSIFATCYIVSAVIIGSVVFFESLFGYDITNRVYAYNSKNSTAQILLTAVIFIFIFKVNIKNIILKTAYILLGIFLIYVVILMKSRATIIAIPFILLVILWMSKFNKRAVLFVTLGTIAVIVYLLLNPDVWESFIDNILLGGRNRDNLSDISSGRSDEWDNFPSEFSQRFLVGYGKMKRESLILTVLLEYGILGGIPILIYAVSPLIFCICKLNLKKFEVQSFLLIIVTYLIDGIFEQLAPFGPGVKCYALWFIMGIMMTTNVYRKKSVE